MSTMNSAQFKEAVAPLLIDIMDGVGRETPVDWTKIFRTETGPARKFFEAAVYFGFGLASQKGEGARIARDEGGTARTGQFFYTRWGTSFGITEDLQDDADMLDIVSRFSRWLMRAMMETREVVHVDVLNRAANSAYAGMDGVSLFNASHPLAYGGTYDNTFANPTDPSHAAIDTMLVRMLRAPNERGLPRAVQAKRIICAPEQYRPLIEILQSEKRAGTANNNINSLKVSGDIEEAWPVQLRRLTSSTWWAIQSDVDDGLTHVDHPKGKLKRAAEGDFETGDGRWKASERYWAGWKDSQCLWGQTGT